LNPFTAVLLGIIQGITEFLPISSTAHLTLAGKLFGLVSTDHPEAWTQFIAVMQLGTLAAVLVYFFRDILGMTRAVVRDLSTHGGGLGWKGYSKDSRLAFAIAIGTLPVGFIGFALKHVIEGVLTKTTAVIAASLIVLALLLWLAEKLSRRTKDLSRVSFLDALIIGCAQALALIPGSSRSGTTMTAALFIGFNRESAARFSFLLSIPAVAASGLFEMLRIDEHVFHLGMGNLVVATIVSGIAGYAAIAWLLRYLVRHTMMVFVWYRIVLGLILIFLLFQGLMQQ
jgi:undecaprenyl-diphosphatase